MSVRKEVILSYFLKGRTLSEVPALRGRELTFHQSVDAQPDRGEVSLADLPAQLVEADSPAEHQLVGHPLVVGHVIDQPLKGRLLHPLLFVDLWDGRCWWGGQGLGGLLHL